MPNPHHQADPPAMPGVVFAAFVLAILSVPIPPLAPIALVLALVARNVILEGKSQWRRITLASIVMSSIGLAIGVVILAVIAIRPHIRVPRNITNTTNVRGIHQALVIHAQGNNLHYPGLDRDGNIVSPSVEARFQILLEDNHFSGTYAISFSETQGKTPWTSGPVTTANYSFSMLQLPDTGDRLAEWRQTNSADAPVVTDRVIPTANGFRSVHTDPKDPNAIEWRGSVGWNDNHVSFEPDFILDTVYGEKAFSDDNIFEPVGNDDGWMVYTGNGK